MVKFVFIWPSGHIFHVIAPDKAIAWEAIPLSFLSDIPFRCRETFTLVHHVATRTDYNNPNCVVEKVKAGNRVRP